MFENPLPKRYHSIAATGYRPDGEEVEGKWVIHPEMAAAGLWTTPSQLIQYAIEIQDISQNETNGLLQFSTVKEMLTPGLNERWLGPHVRESTFGHTGGSQGFKSSLIAWRDLPFALVIMVNAKSDQIIRELELAIATEYQLPGITPIAISDLSPEELSKYVGTYELPDYGPLTIKISGNALEVSADFIDETVYWLPQSKTLFIDRDYLNQIHRFEIVGGNVTSLLLLGESSFRAVKSN